MSKFLFSAAALVALASAIPIAPKTSPSTIIKRDTPYTFYRGDGSTGAGWPSEDAWLDFETLFSDNQGLMGESCSQFGQDNDSSDEISEIHDAIVSISGSTGVDSRFILAVIIQESKGCVRVPTTGNGVTNPGLMQDHDGAGTCNSNGAVQDPCPDSEITQMIQDGTGGTSQGDGLEQTLSEAANRGTSGSQQVYVAARIYNSGSVDPSGDLGAGGSRHCYSSDIANRLLGWVDSPTSCTLDG